MRLNKTFILTANQDKLGKSDILAINRDLENAFTALQIIDNRHRVVTADPQDATPANRPLANRLGEVVMYSSNLYFCTNLSTPAWKKITAT